MKIGLFAHDVGPHNMLKLVAEAAKVAGHEVLLVPAQKVGAASEALQQLNLCDVLAFTPSAFQTHEEVRIIKTTSVRRTVLIEDVPSAAIRPGMQTSVRQVWSVLAAMPQYVREARRFGYTNVQFVGVPPHWEKSYREMMAPTAADLGGQKIVFFNGIKDPFLCNKILASLIIFQTDRPDIKIAFRPHPAEEKNEVAARERALITPRGSFFDVTGYSPAELVNTAEFSVFTGGATDSIVAAFARKRGVFYNTAEVRERNLKQGILDGEWFVPLLGGLFEAREDEAFIRCCHFVLHEKGKDQLRYWQEESFPLPTTWDTAPLLVQYLEKVQKEALATI